MRLDWISMSQSTSTLSTWCNVVSFCNLSYTAILVANHFPGYLPRCHRAKQTQTMHSVPWPQVSSTLSSLFIHSRVQWFFKGSPCKRLNDPCAIPTDIGLNAPFDVFAGRERAKVAAALVGGHALTVSHVGLAVLQFTSGSRTAGRIHSSKPGGTPGGPVDVGQETREHG